MLALGSGVGQIVIAPGSKPGVVASILEGAVMGTRVIL